MDPGAESQDREPEAESQVFTLGTQDGEAAEQYQGQTDVSSLRQAYQNERNAPEALKYEENLVERIQSRIQDRETLISEYDQDKDRGFLMSMMLYELVRVRCLLRMYLRTRLRKIEQHVTFILNDPDAQARCSQKELAYAKTFFITTGQTLKAAMLDHMPKNFNSLVKESAASEQRDMIDAPDVESHVFCRVLTDCGAIAVDSEGVETQDFLEGDLYAVRYDRISDLLSRKMLELI